VGRDRPGRHRRGAGDPLALEQLGEPAVGELGNPREPTDGALGPGIGLAPALSFEIPVKVRSDLEDA
jgi:hypothetical protein